MLSLHRMNSLAVFASQIALWCISPASAQQYQPDPRAAALVAKMTLEEKIDLLSGASMMSTHGLPRLAIPALQMTDGPVGAHIPQPSTALGAGIGLAASWDVELAQATGVQLGRDARSRGAHFLLGPGVNLYRSPLNGRNFEYFGEDPYLASRITVGYINGVQSQGVGATIKHYLGNNSEYARHSADSLIDEHTLHEIYLPAFESAVKDAHTAAVMCSYNLTNGRHMCENGPLLSDTLKKQLGFDGLLMSDWFATYDGVASVNNGLDLEMPFGLNMNRRNLLPAVKDGRVPVAIIDEHVERLLSTAFRFGWMDRTRQQMDLAIPRLDPKGTEVALRNALEGTVLLKNNGLLPLAPASTRTIAVLGQDAYPAVPAAGGSGYVQAFRGVSLLEGISTRFKGATVTYARGVKNINHLALESDFHPTADSTAQGVTVESWDNAFIGPPKSARTETSMTFGKGFNADPETAPDYSTLTLEQLGPMLAPASHGANQRWTGYLKADTTGVYYAFVQTGSRFRLLVDDKVEINNSVLAKAALNQRELSLTPGVHKMTVEVSGGGDFGSLVLRAGLVRKDTIVDPYALALARKADVVVIGAGFTSDSETEGSDRGYDLPFGQDDLIEQVAAANKNTVVALTSGGSVNVAPWLGKVAGLFELWYPGQEGGTAFAQLLAGDRSPSGHLPISWEKLLSDNPSAGNYWFTDAKTQQVDYREGVFMGYRGYDKLHREPLFPFGFGLSYTKFAVSNLQVAALKTAGSYTVSVEVRNIGSSAAAEVVQLYVHDPKAAPENAARELKAFQRILLEPGEGKTVALTLTPRSFAHYQVTGKTWRAEEGVRQILVGDDERHPLAQKEITIGAIEERY